jgi:hypothetical protein
VSLPQKDALSNEKDHLIDSSAHNTQNLSFDTDPEMQLIL